MILSGMDFENYFKKLREKPEKIRYTILFASVFLTMGFIIVVWLTVSFFWKKEQAAGTTGFSPSPFSVLKDDFSRFYEAIKQK